MTVIVYDVEVIACLSDVDECAESREVCMEGRCRNTVGSYVCDCEDGFTVQHGVCTGTRSMCTLITTRAPLQPWLTLCARHVSACSVTSSAQRYSTWQLKSIDAVNK